VAAENVWMVTKLFYGNVAYYRIVCESPSLPIAPGNLGVLMGAHASLNRLIPLPAVNTDEVGIEDKPVVVRDALHLLVLSSTAERLSPSAARLTNQIRCS